MLRVSTLSPLAPTVSGLWLLGFFCVSSAAAQSLPEQTAHHLYRRLQIVPVPQTIVIRGEPLAALPPLRRFYAQRDYQPAWSYDSQLSPSVGALITAIREAEREGLTPHDYHLAAIEAEVHHRQAAVASSRPGWLAELDLLLTDAFLLYASHLLHGRTSPTQENAMWGVKRDNVDPAAVLQAALATNTVVDSLQRLLPSHPAYAKLQQALARYRELAAGGGWPTVPIGPTLRKGDQGTRVAMLRTRLAAESDLPREDVDTGDFFDGAVEQAVQSFQRRHGLDSDGVVGPLTLAALNVSAEHRVQQILLNMERWRWLPRELGPRAVVVNTAGFLLEVVEHERTVLTTRIVVGKPFTRTPLFHAAITSVLLNPAWNIPGGIARKEMLPLIRKNPSYLAKHHITVLHGWGPQTKGLDPRVINWTKLSARHFPYRLRQEPGPHNALGQVKFNLPNPFTVYLHDTPARALFTKSMRAFSHGCIRVEKPIELAAYLLRDSQQWPHESLLFAIEQGEQQTVTLPHPVPVYVGYWTAWVDQGQQVYFAPDLYDRDAALGKRKIPDNTKLGRTLRRPSSYSSTHSQSCEKTVGLSTNGLPQGTFLIPY